ncbi:MAG: hypothetical protein KBT88_12185 [Gammaproteobacteria bacterium]|nr:hypothetical protein [Gammaproteobacteria bacterium]MBQ0840534.1 hypothetical protein [Gammaproteobacteria bacterium]
MLVKLNDKQEALRDSMLIRAGALNSNLAHPQAKRHLDNNDNLTRSLADSFAPIRSGSSASSITASGLSSSDFKNVFADTLAIISSQSFTQNMSHRELCSILEMPNFNEHSFPKVGVAFTLEKRTEGAESKNVINLLPGSGLTSKVDTYSKQIKLSREVLANDEIEAITAHFSAGGTAALRTEKTLAYGLLESNPTLGDSEAMFHTSHGNLMTAATFDLAAIGLAVAAMRRQTLQGSSEAADLKARFLVVSPELEAEALAIVHLNGLGLEVVSSPLIGALNWYLLADPSVAPVIGLLLLDKKNRGPEVAAIRPKKAFDGTTFAIRHDAGVVALGRSGAVKGIAL